jgi:hypothetical protein
MIGHLVDFAFLNPPVVSDEPFAPMREMLQAVRPDTWVVNYDTHWIPFWRPLAKELGIELRVLELNRDDSAWKEFSTSRIVEKIRNLPK